MDDFREWLSDNLRYFMLGGAILVIVLVLIFGVRACVGGKKGNSNEDQKTAQSNQENDPSSPANDGETDEKKDASPATDTNAETTMEKASTEVTELIQSYYKAFGEKDIATLKTIEDGFTPADESQINSRDYIDGYEVQDVYAKKGLTDGSYVVYVVFNYICTGIETPVPALSQFYVETDSDGNLKIKGGADEDADISAYVKKLESEKDVQDLIAKVKADYEAAQAGDPLWQNFFRAWVMMPVLLQMQEQCLQSQKIVMFVLPQIQRVKLSVAFLQERKLKRRGRKVTGYRSIMMDRPDMYTAVCWSRRNKNAVLLKSLHFFCHADLIF